MAVRFGQLARASSRVFHYLDDCMAAVKDTTLAHVFAALYIPGTQQNPGLAAAVGAPA
jgi:hypothetical protein